jgi:hypothetical protein
MKPQLIILFIALLFIITIVVLVSRPTKKEEISFPFRAIWKEMPDHYRTGPIPIGTALITDNEPSPPMTQLPHTTVSSLAQSNINELYPVSYTRGEVLDRMYNVRPQTYGALTLRDTERPYQDINSEFIRVGTVSSVDKTDDTVMTLFRRDIAPERDMYEYKVVDKTNGNDIEIYLSINVTLLRNGDKITIPGYESKGYFEVNLDTRYRYSRLKPF